MIRASTLLRLGAALALGAALSGCVSLFPKSNPAQLYRFAMPEASAKAMPSANAVGVFWANGDFQRESSGDRIFTVTGDQAADIAESRWAAPAQVMFEEAVQAAFDTAPGHVRLVPRGLPTATDETLRVDVRNFETRYDAGPGAPPTVLVRLHATLARDRGRSVVSEQIFEARAPASDNRVGPIVTAYNTAVRDVLGQLVAWTEAKTPAAAA
jgi:cholesterol transport system auxiliary component